jgi:hypothetical protein
MLNRHITISINGRTSEKVGPKIGTTFISPITTLNAVFSYIYAISIKLKQSGKQTLPKLLKSVYK